MLEQINEYVNILHKERFELVSMVTALKQHCLKYTQTDADREDLFDIGNLKSIFEKYEPEVYRLIKKGQTQ